MSAVQVGEQILKGAVIPGLSERLRHGGRDQPAAVLLSPQSGLKDLPKRLADMHRLVRAAVELRKLAVIAEAAEHLLPLLEPERHLFEHIRRFVILMIHDRLHLAAHGVKGFVAGHIRRSWW